MINDRPYSVNEIELILSQCDIRSRVTILLMASTGMRIGGLRDCVMEISRELMSLGFI